MSREPVRIGFVGAGRHARTMLYPSLHYVPDARLTAIATETAESVARAEADFHVPCYQGYEKLLADDAVEAVIVCVPGNRAAEISSAALKADKHVLCETPAITSPDDAVLVGKALSGRDRIYQVGFCLRYAPIYRKVKDLLTVWREEADGNFCLDIRYYEWIHHFYNLSLFLVGDINRVVAWEQGKSRRVVLEFANGDLGTIRSTAFLNHAIPYEEVEVTRADGLVRASNRSELLWYREPDTVSSREMTFDSAGATVWRNPTSAAYNRVNTLYASGYAAEIESFVECIRDGKMPLSSLEDAAKTDALRRAAESAIQERQ